MPNGFFGKILWVDLTEETFKEENLPEELYRQFFGGYSLACKLIYEHMPAKADALGPEAILGIFPGLLTGTVAPLSGRYMVAGKSPLTRTWGDSNSGGYFGPEIKKCGYDGILIKGIAESPKYILIVNDERQILNASDIWGLDIIDTEKKLKKKHGNKIRTAEIGQAGEKLSLISGIVCEKGRIAARSGFGAVMGSKKLKALVLKGNKKVSVANKEALLKSTKEYNNAVKNANTGSLELYKTLGSTCLNDICAQIGDTPIKNWRGNYMEDFPKEKYEKISGIEINKYRQKQFGCYACSVHCGGIVKVPEIGIEECLIPEYETCASFGHLLLNEDLFSLFTINDLCNRAGIDSISAGGTIAFAIECFENGLINKDDTDGLELTWGNSEVIVKLLKKMINREGFGDILADGSKIASKKIGKGSEKYAIHSLGQELPMHDSKYFKSLGLTYAFDPTPGRHTAPSTDIMVAEPLLIPNGLVEGFSLPRRFKRAGHDDRFKAQKMVTGLKQATNALGICELIHIFQKYPLLELIKAVVGWDLSVDELLKTGYRIQTLRQAFTIREGIILANNTISGRAIGDPPFETGPHKGKTIDYKTEYKGFCKKIGWNPENGYPLKETLVDMNLDFVIKDLY